MELIQRYATYRPISPTASTRCTCCMKKINSVTRVAIVSMVTSRPILPRRSNGRLRLTQ